MEEDVGSGTGGGVCFVRLLLGGDGGAVNVP